MYLIDEYLESHPFIIDSAINDALQGRARCESDATQKELEEYTKLVFSEAKPHDYNYFREEFSKAINGTKVRNPYIPIATPWLNGPTTATASLSTNVPQRSKNSANPATCSPKTSKQELTIKN